MSTTEMNKGLNIPWEVADGITLATLKDQREYLVKELYNYEKEGQWMHPEDAENSRLHLIPALDTIIKYFGG